MFKQKYMDGTPVEPEYLDKVSILIKQAAEAESVINIDDLERAAEYNQLLQEIDWNYYRCDAKNVYDKHHRKWLRICQLKPSVDPDGSIMKRSRGQ